MMQNKRNKVLLVVVAFCALFVLSVGCGKRVKQKEMAKQVVTVEKERFMTLATRVVEGGRLIFDYLNNRDELMFQREILNPLKAVLAEKTGSSLQEVNVTYKKVADALVVLDKKLGGNRVKQTVDYGFLKTTIDAAKKATEAKMAYNQVVEVYNALVSEVERVSLLE